MLGTKPRSFVEYDAMSVFSELLTVAPSSLDLGLRPGEAGVDSLMLLVGLERLNHLWGTSVTLAQIAPELTFFDMASAIAEASGAQAPPGLVVFETSPVVRPGADVLVCMPSGNGEVGYARRWMYERSHLFALRGYGILMDEHIPDDHAMLSCIYADSIERHLDRPRLLTVVGYSLGAWLAHAVCANLGIRGHRARAVLLDPLPPIASKTLTDFMRSRQATWRAALQLDPDCSWQDILHQARSDDLVPRWFSIDHIERLEQFQYSTMKALAAVPWNLGPECMVVLSESNRDLLQSVGASGLPEVRVMTCSHSQLPSRFDWGDI